MTTTLPKPDYIEAVTATTQPRPDHIAALISELYARWTLDCVVEMAYAVSMDFVTRPQQYKDSDIPEAIVKLRMAYGTAVDLPNQAQRQAMLMPILGKSDWPGYSTVSMPTKFDEVRMQFLEACVKFAERQTDTGVEMLRGNVRSALVSFQTYFDALKGRSTAVTAVQTKELWELVLSILTSSGVSRVFNQSPPGGQWPFSLVDSVDNASGALIIEQIGAMLPLPQGCKVDYAMFILLQRVAQEGAHTLQLVLTTHAGSASHEDLEKLITQSYVWSQSLMNLSHPSQLPGPI